MSDLATKADLDTALRLMSYRLSIRFALIMTVGTAIVLLAVAS